MLDQLRDHFPQLDGTGLAVLVALLAEAPVTRRRLAQSVGEDLDVIDEVLEMIDPGLLILDARGAQTMISLSAKGVALRDRILGAE